MKKIREIIIETPEKIHFSYHIAEIGTRIAAYLIDEIIQMIIVVIIVISLILSGYSIQTHVKEGLTNITAAFLMIMVFLLRWFYFVLFEAIMEGQSPGKKLMRIRVIRDNGDSLDFETIILRNFLRVIDGFPVIPFTGGFIALIDFQNRRLGDIIADTIVVTEIQYNLTIPDFQVRFIHTLQSDEVACATDEQRLSEDKIAYATVKHRLNENELYILRRFLNEYHKLPEMKQQEIAAELANQVSKRLGIEETITDSFLFLERIYKQYGV
jgi:uncharacterized RDD family membrane protein YckC